MGWFKDIIGGITQPVASVFGSVLGYGAANRQSGISQNQFDRQFYNSIQARVEDAKRAGIHPLYALGSSPSASPTFITGQSDTGSYVKDALGALGEMARKPEGPKGLTFDQKEARRNNRAARQASRAQAHRDEAEAISALSAAALAERQALQKPSVGFNQKLGPGGRPYYWNEFYDQYSDQVIVNPTQEANIELPESLGAVIYGQGKSWQHKRYGKGAGNRLDPRKLRKKYRGPRRKRHETR